MAWARHCSEHVTCISPFHSLNNKVNTLFWQMGNRAGDKRKGASLQAAQACVDLATAVTKAGCAVRSTGV